MLAAAALALSLVVRVYDSAGIVPGDKATALATAQAILAQAGLAVSWRDGGECTGAGGCGEGSHDEPTIPELIMRIVIAPPETAPGSLGFSIIDVAEHSGTLGTVYADRVAQLAALAGSDPGRLLGRAMAHEIGHLLLGTTSHASRGLMRGAWTTVELHSEQPLDWRLQREDIAGMRRGLVARTRRLEKPAAVVAGATRRDPPGVTQNQWSPWNPLDPGPFELPESAPESMEEPAGR
jgi:hypothetical protein